MSPKHPFMLYYYDFRGKLHALSFPTTRKRSASKRKLEEAGYTVRLGEQGQLFSRVDINPQTATAPGYDIPY